MIDWKKTENWELEKYDDDELPWGLFYFGKEHVIPDVIERLDWDDNERNVWEGGWNQQAKFFRTRKEAKTWAEKQVRKGIAKP